MLMDAAGHYNRPELLCLMIDRTPTAHVHERATPPAPGSESVAQDLRASVARIRISELSA
jgi:aliphatic nitrilase